MANKPRTQHEKAMTGNAGLNYAGWQLSRRGWHVMPTIRNARGSDLFVTNADETKFFGVQSKALNKRAAIELGLNLDNLRSEYWIITMNANSDSPICYIMSLGDVQRLASRDKGGENKYWLEARDYERDEFRGAWDRLGSPLAGPPKGTEVSPKASQPEQNGVRRPKPDSLCGKAWEIFDRLSQTNGSPASIGESLELAKAEGLNKGNVRTEYTRWRKFHGITGRIPRLKAMG